MSSISKKPEDEPAATDVQARVFTFTAWKPFLYYFTFLVALGAFLYGIDNAPVTTIGAAVSIATIVSLVAWKWWKSRFSSKKQAVDEAVGVGVGLGIVAIFAGLFFGILALVSSVISYWTNVAAPGCKALYDVTAPLVTATTAHRRDEVERLRKSWPKSFVVWDLDVRDVSVNGNLDGRCVSLFGQHETSVTAVPIDKPIAHAFREFSKGSKYRLSGFPVLEVDDHEKLKVLLVVDKVWGTGGLWGNARSP